MILKINSLVENIDLSEMVQYSPAPYSKYLIAEAGDHYKLLAFLSLQLPVNSVVGDIGTFVGNSALALAMNSTVQVMSYDVENFINGSQPPNVKLTRLSGIDALPYILDAKIILIDVSPHDGVQEEELLRFLEERSYRGIVILDDISLNPEMRNFWSSISLKKIDVTSYGHWSGTGIVIFDPNSIDVVVE